MNNTIIPNGCFTVSNLLKSTHRTVKIHTAKKGNLEGKRIISLLTGSDNNNSYSGFGFVENGEIKVWRRHSGSRTMTWLANFIASEFSDQKKDHPGIELLVEKRCMKCNRKLTTPESIKAGIGPECIKRSPALSHSPSLVEIQASLGLI